VPCVIGATAPYRDAVSPSPTTDTVFGVAQTM